MSSTASVPSDSPPDPAADAPPRLPGFHLVVVPRVGLATCAAFERAAGLIEALRAARADEAIEQYFCFAPDGTRWETTQDPPYLLTPTGPVYLGAEPAVPATADPYGRSPHAAAVAPPLGPPAAGAAGPIGDGDDPGGWGDVGADLAAEFGDDDGDAF